MCDSATSRGRGWIGWLPMPETSLMIPNGPWIDLSYPLSKSVPRASIFPEPSFRRVRSLPEDPINVTEMQMVVHIGTHVDAPRHFFMDGPAFHEIPLDRLTGPGVVVSVPNKTAGETIEIADSSGLTSRSVRATSSRFIPAGPPSQFACLSRPSASQSGRGAVAGRSRHQAARLRYADAGSPDSTPSAGLRLPRAPHASEFEGFSFRKT